MKPIKVAAKSRLQRAAAGTSSASRFRSARSQREERERREADATAEVYASFVASFQTDDSTAKTFVRGSTLKDGRETASNSATPQHYTLKSKAEPASTKKAASSMVMAFGGDDSDSDEPAPFKPSVPRGRGGSTPSKPAASGGREQLSGMDQMVADMKADADRGVLAGGTSFGDANSTNLFVGNIAPGTTEEALVKRFATHGPLLSAKVLWPRSPAEEARGFNNGFVCFAHREDADAALRALDGARVGRARIAVSWAKGVPPAAYDALMQAAIARGEDCRPRAERLATPRPPGKGRRGDGLVPRPEEAPALAGPALPEDHPMLQAARAAAAAHPPAGAPLRRVPWPPSPVRRRLLNRTAAYVAVDGYPLEQALIKQEAPRQRTSEYGFLFAPDSPEGTYYRWRVYACVCGEGFEQWRREPFQMERGGEWWVPPSPPTGHDDGCDSDGSWGSWASEGGEGGSRAPPSAGAGGPSSEQTPARGQGGRAGKGAVPLTDAQAEEWQRLLGALVPSSEGVGTAMVWGVRHACSAAQVVDAVLRRLGEGLPSPAQAAPWDSGASASLGEGSPSTVSRLACVYLLGDLLCNAEAKAPHALAYARAVQRALPLAFHFLGHLLNEVAAHCGRMSAAGLRERLLRLLHAWGGGSVLPPPFLLGLETALVWRGAGADSFLQLAGAYAAGGAAACAGVGVDEEHLAALARQVGCVDTGGCAALLQRLLAVRTHAGAQLNADSTVPPLVAKVVEGGLTPDEAMAAAAREGAAPADSAPLPPAVDQDAIPDLSGWRPSLRYNRHKRGSAPKRQRVGGLEGDEGGASEDDGEGRSSAKGGFIRVDLAGSAAAAPLDPLNIAQVHDAELEAAEAAAAAAAAAEAAQDSDSDLGEDWEFAGAVDGGPLAPADEACLAAGGWLELPTLPPPPPAPPGADGTATLALPPPPPPDTPPSADMLGLPAPPQS